MAIKSLKALFNNRIEQENPKINEIDDDIKLGQKYRAFLEARRLLNKILEDLDSFDVVNRKKSEFNKEV